MRLGGRRSGGQQAEPPATSATNGAGSGSRTAAGSASRASSRARSPATAVPVPSRPTAPPGRSHTWFGRGSIRISPARAAVTCAATSARAAASGSAGRVWPARALDPVRHADLRGGELAVRRGHDDAVHAPERPAHGALLRGLVLEVELVERLLADLREQAAAVEPGYAAPSGGRSASSSARSARTPASSPGRRTLTATGAPSSSPRWTCASGVTAAGDRGRARRARARAAAPRVAQRPLDPLGRQRDARLRAGARQPRLERLQPRRQPARCDDARRAPQRDAAVRGALQQHPAGVEQRAQRGREFGRHPGRR